jgi:flagellar motor switch protein FliG
MYLETVSRLQAIVEDLKLLPPEKLEAAAEFIRRLKPISQDEREAILARTFGSLSQEDADAMQKAIEEGCERVDAEGW